MAAKILFVTGTDTGVGKTVVSSLVLAHLLQTGRRPFALKPFCTGDRMDAVLLHGILRQCGEVDQPLGAVNPFYFAKPVTPTRAGAEEGITVGLAEAVEVVIGKAREGFETLLVEGAGGLLSPLGEDFSLLDLIERTRGDVLIAAPNRLGVLNHTLLTVEVLGHRGIKPVGVALVDHGSRDVSHNSNLEDLEIRLHGVPVVPVPFLENYTPDPIFIWSRAVHLKEELRRLITNFVP